MDIIDLQRIRDEIGTSPDDDTIEEIHADTGHWILTAVRVLKRRRADAAGGGQETKSFTLTGVLSVGLGSANLSALDRQIERLEALYAGENDEDATSGVTFGRMHRADRPR